MWSGEKLARFLRQQSATHQKLTPKRTQARPNVLPPQPNTLDLRRRNHTQHAPSIKSKNPSPLKAGRSAQVLKYDQHTPAHRSLSYSSSPKAAQPLLFRKPRGEPEEIDRQQHLLQQRQEKVSKLKMAYLLKKDPQKKSLIVPQARFNTIAVRSTSQQKTYQKQEPFIRKHNSQNNKTFFLPKFLDFCEQRQRKKSLPQKDTDHQQCGCIYSKITKVHKMNTVSQTPPLQPVTHNQTKSSMSIDKQWIINNYQPQLQIMQDLNLSQLTYQKVVGGSYIGQVHQDGVPEGKGILFYQGGRVYEGEFKVGEPNGVGHEKYPDGSSYTGQFAKGKRQGKGQFRWSNGQVYDGEWRRGKKEGSGMWKGNQGISYVGEWRSDVIEGFGVLTEGVTRYEGQMKQFMKEGNGTITFDSGEIFTGQFRHNLPNGTGDYRWPNGDHYHGHMLNGKRHGQGLLTYQSGGHYQGCFQNDKKSGEGRQHYEDGLDYEGEFQNDLRHGLGALRCDNTIVYEGYWVNNSAVDGMTAPPQSIQQETSSILEKETQRNSQSIQPTQPTKTVVRNKIMMRKQQKIRQKAQIQEPKQEIKGYRRSCGCVKHRHQSPYR